MRVFSPSKSIRSGIFAAFAWAISIIISPPSFSAALSDDEVSIPLGAGEDDVRALLAGDAPFVFGVSSPKVQGNGVSHGSSDAISGGCSDEVQADRRPDPQRNSSPRGNNSCHLKVALDETLLLGNYGSSTNWAGLDEGLTSGDTRALTALALTPAQNEVPAPATILLLLAAVPGLLFLRQRRGQ